jgi:hypothetical protein
MTWVSAKISGAIHLVLTHFPAHEGNGTIDAPLRLISLITALDPAILADVQRALKMKARREARLKAPGPTRTDTSPQSFFTDSSSHSRDPISPLNIAFPPVNRADTGEDFVASLGASVPHPMPRSLNDGATLDWSGKEAVEEPKHDRKWSLSITKRKIKDKAMSISSLDHSHSPLDISRDSNYEGLSHPFQFAT